MFRMIRPAVLALVLATLVTSTAYAAPRAGRTLPAHDSGLGAIRGWVVRVFSPVIPASKAPGRAIMEKEGSSMDPNGKSGLSTFLWSISVHEWNFVDQNGL